MRSECAHSPRVARGACVLVAPRKSRSRGTGVAVRVLGAGQGRAFARSARCRRPIATPIGVQYAHDSGAFSTYHGRAWNTFSAEPMTIARHRPVVDPPLYSHIPRDRH